jgi:hypothetical protein
MRCVLVVAALMIGFLVAVACQDEEEGDPTPEPTPAGAPTETAVPTRVPVTPTPVPSIAASSPIPPTSSATSPPALQWAEFDRWGIAFEHPKAWTEWSAEKISAVKSALSTELERALAQDPTVTKRTLEDLAIIATQDQEAVLTVAVLRYEGAVAAQTLLAEEQRKVDDYKAAGDVTKVWQIAEITVAGRPAIIVDVERGAGGRGYAVTIISGERGIQIQCVVLNLQRFADYETDFNHIFDTLTITTQ